MADPSQNYVAVSMEWGSLTRGPAVLHEKRPFEGFVEFVPICLIGIKVGDGTWRR